MNKNLKKLIVCVMAVAAVATSNLGGVMPIVSANAAVVQTEQFKAIVVSADGYENKVGSTLNDIFTVRDVFENFGVNPSEVSNVTELKVSQTDKEKITVVQDNNKFLKSTFDLSGESRETNNDGTEIKIKYTLVGSTKEYSLKFNVVMSKDINYNATIVSGTVDGKKKEFSNTLSDNFTVKSALAAFNIDSSNITITDIKVSETDSEKIKESENILGEMDVNTRFDILGTSGANNNKGVQVRIRYTNNNDPKKEHTLKFNVTMHIAK